jgi:hypothetical protein
MIIVAWVWYFRIVELSGARWACRHGRRMIDIHAELGPAIEHLTAVASQYRPATLFVHRLDGSVEILGVV